MVNKATNSLSIHVFFTELARRAWPSLRTWFFGGLLKFLTSFSSFEALACERRLLLLLITHKRHSATAETSQDEKKHHICLQPLHLHVVVDNQWHNVDRAAAAAKSFSFLTQTFCFDKSQISGECVSDTDLSYWPVCCTKSTDICWLLFCWTKMKLKG